MLIVEITGLCWIKNCKIGSVLLVLKTSIVAACKNVFCNLAITVELGYNEHVVRYNHGLLYT